MTPRQRTAARWGVFVGLLVTSFALYWAATAAGAVVQVALLMVLVAIAAVAALIR